jgi:nucleosome assembly protein 1-like 1
MMRNEDDVVDPDDLGNDLEGEDVGDDEDDPLANLPPYVLHRVEKVRELDNLREDLMKSYLVERAALEKKYYDQMVPLYDARRKIVIGEQDQAIAAENPDEEEENTDNQEEEERAKGIPQFWVCAMMNCETIADRVSEDDVDCLTSLQNITCVDDVDGKGFTIRLFFAPNDYFHDTVLSKSYKVPNLLTSDEPMLKDVVGCPIQWKSDDQTLTFRTVQKKQRGKGKHAGQVRTVSKSERVDSFFHWFDPPKMPTSADEMDEEQAEHLEEVYDEDYEVAQAFRLFLVPKAIQWFTGEVSSYPEHFA